MLLLMLFALIAGAGTAITPCVLPVLPALLSASAAGGRRRPLGIVIGLAVTFTIAIVALAQLVKGVGLASGAARTLAIIVLIGFGLVLLIPELAARIQAPLSRLARFGPKTRGDGFWSGVAVGGALGFVCAPCAGPILAAVTSVSASSGATAQVVAVALSYAVGLSAVLLLYALGGRAVIERVRRSARGHVVERTLGVVLIATGVLMAANLDVRFEEALAKSQNAAGVPARSDKVAGDLELRAEPARVTAARVGVRGASARSLDPAGARDRGRLDPRRQDAVAARPRRSSGLHRHPAVVQHSRRRSAVAGDTPRPRRARGLLDVHVHQLHPHAAVRRGPVQDVPPVRPRDRGRGDPGVHVRAGRLQRQAGDPFRRPHLPGRAGQQVRDLERVPEPVLAGGVPDRRQGPGPPHPVRRGQLQGGRGRGPAASARGGRAPAACADDRARDHRRPSSSRLPRPTSTTSAPRGSRNR